MQTSPKLKPDASACAGEPQFFDAVVLIDTLPEIAGASLRVPILVKQQT
jgi:hypothetical protein